MKTAKQPKYLKDLEDAGMSESEFIRAQQWFRDHGVTMGPKRDRSGRYTGEFTWFAIPDDKTGPTYITCLTGIGSTVDMLDSPSATLKQFGKTL